MSKFLKYVLVFIGCVYFVSRMPVFASGFGYEEDWVDYYYNQQGEPDYADGDLEDKLGDSGYYADLFPEENFSDSFYDSDLPEEMWEDYYSEFEYSNMEVEDFIKQKEQEYYRKNNIVKEPLKERIKDFGNLDMSKYVIGPGNKPVQKEIIVIDASSHYDPEKNTFLKMYLDSWGEELMSTVTLTIDSNECRYNKETKLFEIIKR